MLRDNVTTNARLYKRCANGVFQIAYFNAKAKDLEILNESVHMEKYSKYSVCDCH